MSDTKTAPSYLMQMGLILLGTVAKFGAAAFQALVAVAIWTWFLTPAFHIQAPPIMLMMGLRVLLVFMFGPVFTNKMHADVDEWLVEQKFDKSLAGVTYAVASLLFGLFILVDAWLIHFIAGLVG